MQTDYSSRYECEHVLLPGQFYQNGAAAILHLMGTQGATLMRLYHQLEKEHRGYVCPYTEKDFQESHMLYHCEDDSALVMRIQMPTPEVSPLCRAIYLCLAKDSPRQMYFSSELMSDNNFALCSWTPEKTHLNYGRAPETYSDEFDRVAQIFFSTAKQ